MAGVEVLRRDLVEELDESLDLVLLLVRDDDAGLLEDVIGLGGTTPCWANAMAVASPAPIQIGR